MFNKLIRTLQIVVLCLLPLVLPYSKSASATAPSELNFTMSSIYQIGIYATTFGSWTSSGVIGSGGEIAESVSFSGVNEYGWFIKNVHSETLLSDAYGTITIQSQAHQDMFEPFGSFTFSGTWVITGGTGLYAGLHGQGTLIHTGMFYEVCPINAYLLTGPCIMETKILTGEGHIDPL